MIQSLSVADQFGSAAQGVALVMAVLVAPQVGSVMVSSEPRATQPYPVIAPCATGAEGHGGAGGCATAA